MTPTSENSENGSEAPLSPALEQLRDRVAQDLALLQSNGYSVLLMLSPLEAFVLLGSLQLALRHPRNTGSSSLLARRIATNIERKITPTQALKEAAAEGWLPCGQAPLEVAPLQLAAS